VTFESPEEILAAELSNLPDSGHMFEADRHEDAAVVGKVAKLVHHRFVATHHFQHLLQPKVVEHHFLVFCAQANA
jgi:hypothetical protein